MDNSPFRPARGQPFQEETGEFGRKVTPAPARDIEQAAHSRYTGGRPVPDALQAEPRFRALRRQADFKQLTVDVGVNPVLYLPADTRTYFLVQNLDAAVILFVGFGDRPNQATGRGLRLQPFVAYEPYQVPQNDIYLTATAPMQALLIYANEN
jgi:hypothetical protein